ncbi:hypothetical protein GMA12_17895 [Kocuria sediminis]|uniref:Uncharacterized protein n=1 Tax=Kocuria sediminis TaxID=1038857 RepID=A0A6N8GQC8_9MICC|nr:hypothetical protein [Kocuria sediminis]
MAAVFPIRQPTVETWVARYLESSEAGLVDRPSPPLCRSTHTPAAVVKLIEVLRRQRKWSTRHIHCHLIHRAVALSPRTVGRGLSRRGIFGPATLP